MKYKHISIFKKSQSERTAKFVCLRTSTRETANQQKQDDQRNERIETVALSGEGVNQVRHAGDGRRDQKQKPELYDAASAQSACVLHDAAQGTEVGRLAPEDVICRHLTPMAKKVDQAASENDSAGHGYTDAKQIPDDIVYFLGRGIA
jgi:hypothetical protein